MCELTKGAYCVTDEDYPQLLELLNDYLFVSKLHYGARTPATPLQIPLTHQKIETIGLEKTYNWIEKLIVTHE